MFGRRRLVTAVLATAAVVLSLGVQAATGIVVPPSPDLVPNAAGDPTSSGKTELVSTNAPNGARQPMISGDGKWDVFTSTDDLAGTDNNGQSEVYARNLVNGETVQLSGGANGSPPPNGDAIQPSISDNGRFVSYIVDRPVLTVTKGGGGNGTVTSSPAGINCGATCSLQVNSGTTVTLTATPAAHSSFTGWSGSGINCPGTGTCVVTVSAGTTVNAAFAAIPQRQLTVNINNNGGTGSVTSDPTGISCPTDCVESYDVGSDVTLTAQVGGTTSAFAGWSGTDVNCPNKLQPCTVHLTNDMTVTATFVVKVNFVDPGIVGGRDASPPVARLSNRSAASSVTALAAPSTGTMLVVCDRDPDGNGTFDEPPGNSCAVVASGGPNGDGSIVTSDRPQLEGFGNRIVWTQRSVVGTTGSTRTHVWTADFTTDTAGVLNVGTPIQVPNTYADPCPNEGGTPNESQPVIGDNGFRIFFTANYPSGCSAILGTHDYTNPFAETDRFDFVPEGCGNTNEFLGDDVTLTGECASGSGGGDTGVDSPSIDQFGSTVLFHFHDAPVVIDFTASATTRVDWMVMTSFRYGSGYTSQVVSRDNAGNIIDSTDGAISGDGRYVVFDTLDCFASDGADLLPCQNPQRPPSHELVARDLVLDAQRQNLGQSRLPGALVTFHDPAVPPNPPVGCTPNPGQQCVSLSGNIDSISMDDNGALTSFTSTAFDLVRGDVNQSRDAFVHTWQPSVSNGPVDIGDVEANDSTVATVGVTVSGFGPLVLGNVSLTGDPGFTIEGNDCSFRFFPFHDGDSCNITVRFAPDDTLGPRSAKLSVESDQFDGGSAQVATLNANVVPNAGLQHAKGDTTRTSVRDNGAQSATGGDESMISGDGRWQVFESGSNLAGHTPIDPSNAGLSNIFVRDLADPQRTLQISLHTNVSSTTAASDPVRTVRVKGHPTGASPDGASFEPSISSNGRFVSFMTRATDMVPMPDLAQGNPAEFALVVCDRDPNGAVDAAGNLLLDQLRDGVPFYRCFWVESGAFASDFPGVDTSSTPKLSGNGTRLTWVENEDFSLPRVKVATVSAPGGNLHAPTNIEYVASDISSFFNNDGVDADPRNEGTTDQVDPTLNENGNKVVYTAGDCRQFSPCSQTAIIERDLVADTSRRFDAAPASDSFLGDSGGHFDPSSVSDDGNRVAFAFGPGSGAERVYVATLDPGTDQITSRIASFDNRGQPAAGSVPAISGDGRYLAYQSSQPNEHNGVDPPNGDCTGDHVFCQIVARDLVHDAQREATDQPLQPSEIVSYGISTDCVANLPPGEVCAGNANSFNPSIDNTGSEIGFDSAADDIVAGDTNCFFDDAAARFAPGGCASQGGRSATDSFVHAWRPTLNAAPGFDFGTVDVGAQKAQNYSVTLSGFGPVSLGSGAVTGLNAGDFSLVTDNCAGETVHDTDPACPFKLRFAPTAAGPRTANLAYPVANNGYPRRSPDGQVHNVALNETLTGIGHKTIKPPPPNAGAVTPEPTTLDFGKQLPLARKPPKTVTLTNTGNGSIAVTDITAEDTTAPGASTDYTIDASACLGVLQPGESCAVTVTFVGHKTGNRDAQLVVTDDQSPDPTIVTLLAKVPEPKLLVNPGVIAPGRVTQISGTGFAPRRLVDVTLDGLSEQATARTNGKGEFDVALVIFRNTPEGPRTVVGHTHDANKSVGADSPLLIAAGTIDDLGLVTRH